MTCIAEQKPQKLELIDTDVVRSYLADYEAIEGGEAVDDFS